MPLRPPAGFIRPGYDPLKVPDAPTIGTATGGDASASVAFTAPSNVGGSAISAYYAVSNPGQITSSGASSPVTVTGLTNGTSYTFTVWALNTYGPSPYSAASGSVTPEDPSTRGLFGGGSISEGNTNFIDYINIPSAANATDFGDLTVARQGVSSCSSTTRALFGGGYSTNYTNIIDYVTVATKSNATDFGDLTQSKYLTASCSSATRGLFAGGAISGDNVNVIEYVTIASVGNGTDFGDLTVKRSGLAGCASSTRGIFGGGLGPNFSNVIDYVTIASTGDATDFGDLISNAYLTSSCSSSTRGLFGGGQSTNDPNTPINVIQYITIASTGNATDFGDLAATRYGLAACSSTTRGVFGGGYEANYSNRIEYVTISSVGNATDFGDLNVAAYLLGGTSNCHGGL